MPVPPDQATIHELCPDEVVAYVTRYAMIGFGYLDRYELETTPNDIVQEAFQRVLEGRRPWNRERYQTPEDFLCSVVDSIAANWRRSVDHRHARGAVRDVEDRNPQPLGTIDGTRDFSGVLYEELLGAVEASGDDEAILVLEGRLDGLSRREIAETLELTVGEVTNATKRLERIIRSHVNWAAISEVINGSH